MMQGRINARSVLGACICGLVAVTVLGGFVMAAAERVGYSEGLWTLFNVVTTVGFGPGPQSALGQLAAVGAFVVATTCWFGIVSVAVEIGLSRFERDALVREALRPLARGRGPKLFHDN